MVKVNPEENNCWFAPLMRNGKWLARCLEGHSVIEFIGIQGDGKANRAVIGTRCRMDHRHL